MKNDAGEPSEVQTMSGPSGVHFKHNPKRDSRVRSWLGKLKRSNKHERTGSHESATTATTTEPKESKDYKEGKLSGEGPSSLSQEASKDEKVEDTPTVISGGKGKEKKERSISPPTPRDSAEMARGRARQSATSDNDEFEEAKDQFDADDLAVPQTMTGRTSQGDNSPARTSSKFTEEL